MNHVFDHLLDTCTTCGARASDVARGHEQTGVIVGEAVALIGCTCGWTGYTNPRNVDARWAEHVNQEAS